MIQALLLPDPVIPPLRVMRPAPTKPAKPAPSPSPAPAAPPARQAGIPLAVGAEVSLVDIQTVRAVRGLDAESVVALIDSGRIRWVWDISLPGAVRRELRFLAAEMAGRPEAVTASRAAAIDLAIGVPASRVRVRVGELEQRWTCSNQTLLRLGRVGEISVEMIGRTKWVRRESLANFLGRRWVS